MNNYSAPQNESHQFDFGFCEYLLILILIPVSEKSAYDVECSETPDEVSTKLKIHSAPANLHDFLPANFIVIFMFRSSGSLKPYRARARTELWLAKSVFIY